MNHLVAFAVMGHMIGSHAPIIGFVCAHDSGEAMEQALGLPLPWRPAIAVRAPSGWTCDVNGSAVQPRESKARKAEKR